MHYISAPGAVMKTHLPAVLKMSPRIQQQSSTWSSTNNFLAILTIAKNKVLFSNHEIIDEGCEAVNK